MVPRPPRRPSAPGPRLALALTLLALAAGFLSAGEPSSDASDATQPGRSLDRALDAVLTAPGPDGSPPRSILLLVDVTRSLREAAFGDRLAQALERQGTRLRGVALGLARAGAKGALTVPPGHDRTPVLTDLNVALAAASTNPVRNLYADVRAAASAFPGDGPGRRLVLVSLDNGDAEDDLEATVKALERQRVECCVIAREAWLSDSYAWSRPGQVSPPRGTTLGAGDGAWPEVPWGWALQQENGHEVAPSGFAAYGLTRLAAASGGRVFLHGAGGGAHACEALGTCAFCAGDHLPAHEGYQPHRLRALAPSVRPRDEVLAADARDPWLRLVLETWERAAKEGLLRSRPPVSAAGGSLRLESRASTVPVALPLGSLSLARVAKDAARLREAGERLLEGYEAALARIDPASGAARHRATADTVRVMLHLTAVNLLLLEGWATGAGPAQLARAEAPPEPPEVPRLAPDQRVVGWTWTTNCLCHGLAPYRDLRLSAPASFGARLDRLEAVLGEFFARYDHTPFGVAVRRSGLSVFHLAVQGRLLPPPPRQGGSTETPEGATTDRPGRGGSGSGESGPATTGR